MNSPRSGKGNLIRYSIYLICFLALVFFEASLTKMKSLGMIHIILFGILGVMVLLFYIYRFNREQRFFEKSFSLPLLGDFSFIALMTIGITAGRILISYLQNFGHLPTYGFQNAYAKLESSNLFWFAIISIGILIPILQQYLSIGFFFNYLFRDNNRASGIIGIFMSGLIFAVLNFQFSPLLLIINIVIGMVFAWSYLYTQTIWVPIYLAVLNGVLFVIMM